VRGQLPLLLLPPRTTRSLERRTLDTTEIRRETRWLIEHGYKRLLLVFGDHPKNNVEHMIEAIEACYSVQRRRA
jgi:2-iminoacetate synthase